MGSRGAVIALAFVVMMMAGGLSTVVVVDAACSNNLSGLSLCYDAVKKGGSAPTSTCCGTVNNWGLTCLCSVLSNYAGKLPPMIDIKQVVSLPKKCGLHVPKGYRCAGVTIP